MSGALQAVAEELYGLPLDDFVAARTAAERQARGDGDRALAAAVKALRKPVVAAWAVNQLVRRRRDLVEQVVALGESLRQAQSLLQGEELRELTRQRRRLVGAVSAEARELAASFGQRLGEAAAAEVESTLTAAMADPSAAEALLSGMLTQPLSSTGLESLDVGSPAGALALPLPAEPPVLRVVRDDGRARREAEERVENAAAAVRRATKELAACAKKRAKQQARLLQLEAEQEELRRRLAELEEASEEAAERVEELDAEVEEAEATLSDARAESDAAARALDAL